MDFDFSPEQQEIHKLANEFADREIAPGARERDRGEVIGCFGLTEPAVGSDATRLQATAKRDGDDWIVNGRKMWISNGSVSKLALVFANAEPSKGHKGITAFLIDR